MKSLLLILSFILANTAMANTLECLPFVKNGSSAGIASRAFLDTDENKLTVILNSSQAVSESLVDARNMGPGAMAFSEEVATRLSLSVTVIPSAGKLYLAVAPFMSMKVPQLLLCK